MDDHPADERLHALLHAADPAHVTVLTAPAVTRALDDLGANISGTHRRRTRRFQVIAAGVLAALLAATAATPAAAHWLGLRTGLFGSRSSTEVDTSEFLDASSPELGPYLDELSREYEPLPPGVTFERTKQRVAAVGGLLQRNGLRSQLAGWAQCAWIAVWLRDQAAGDVAGLAGATSALQTAAAWDIWAAVDGDGQLVAGERVLAEAARAGDRDPLARDFELNCDPLLRTEIGG